MYVIPSIFPKTRTSHAWDDRSSQFHTTGPRIAYVANNQLYLKSLNEEEAKPIPGTNRDVSTPLFSPDGKWIAFFSSQEKKLEKIPLTGGAAVTLAENIELPYEASWSSNGQIIMGQVPQGIVSVPDTGGKPETLVAAKSNEVLNGPQVLPNGEILFTIAVISGGIHDRWDTAQIVVENLKTRERKVIVQSGSGARYLPTGHLVYTVGATVYAVPFDPRKVEVLAAPCTGSRGRPTKPVRNNSRGVFFIIR